MFKNIFKMIIVILSLAALAFNAYAYQSGDFQIWNTNDQDIKIGKATKLTAEEEFRYGEAASEFFYQHYDWGFAWAFDKALEITAGYRLVLERIKHKWMEEDEPYTMLTWRQDIWKFKFDDRNRIEYRHFRYAPDNARYRNRSMLKYPLDFHNVKIWPYVSDEIFVESNGAGLNQNRFQPGLEFELTKYVKFDIAYMMQSARLGGYKWSTVNVLWNKIKIAF